MYRTARHDLMLKDCFGAYRFHIDGIEEMTDDPHDNRFMERALQLARSGEGWVEPNPAVGCVVVRQQRVVGEGWHRKYGGPHAEIDALRQAGEAAQGATLYVSLEPCCHHGKTPPCTEAIIAAGISRVVVGMRDPFPEVSGQGIAALRHHGITVDVGILDDAARRLYAPYLKRVQTGVPWIIGKWAMTLDGKIATSSGDSHWISGTEARDKAHALRGRVDAIMVGRRTAQRDDPLLTARPPGPRKATRIVVDSRARLPQESRLVQTAREVPVIAAVGPEAETARCQRLRTAGVEVLSLDNSDPSQRLMALLRELAARQMTRVLVEGGGRLLGALRDLDQLDEVHAFVAPKLVGGHDAGSPIAGRGLMHIADAWHVSPVQIDRVGQDLHIHGPVQRGCEP